VTALDRDVLAERLVAAERERRTVEPSAKSLPLDEIAAYEVQRAVVGCVQERERTRIAGYKLGLTSAAKQRQMSVDRPVYGTLLSSRFHSEGLALDLASLIHPRVEPEIAVVMRGDLRGPGVTRVEAARAIGDAFAAIEILDSRYANFAFTLPDVMAAYFSSTTSGVPAQSLDLRTLGVVFEKNGEVVATAAGAATMGDPLVAIAWLANRLAECGCSLQAGHIVLTGGLTDAIAVAAGDVVAVTIARLGSLRLRFMSSLKEGPT